MSDAKDYGEPWTASHGCVDDRHNDTIARDATADEAARIVACVNACAGMADPAAEIAALKAENSRQRTALQVVRRRLRLDSADYARYCERDFNEALGYIAVGLGESVSDVTRTAFDHAAALAPSAGTQTKPGG